ncbi:unnamed protein product [Caenorhabditis auriculariae]|uniref:Uncharacterized protein n=1 Tax=Caenorhabditis auriculariae TaxID=2777116 RepID=A0A8S1HNA5_9PELO|nr:unnamed protein product [Caenorhabditis auriculariae]
MDKKTSTYFSLFVTSSILFELIYLIEEQKKMVSLFTKKSTEAMAMEIVNIFRLISISGRHFDSYIFTARQNGLRLRNRLFLRNAVSLGRSIFSF